MTRERARPWHNPLNFQRALNVTRTLFRWPQPVFENPFTSGEASITVGNWLRTALWSPQH